MSVCNNEEGCERNKEQPLLPERERVTCSVGFSGRLLLPSLLPGPLKKKRKRTYRKQPKGYEFPRKYDIVNYLNSMDTRCLPTFDILSA